MILCVHGAWLTESAVEEKVVLLVQPEVPEEEEVELLVQPEVE